MSFYSGPLLDSEPEYEPALPLIVECPICTEVKPLIKVSTCDHYFCEDCIRNYLEIKVVEADVMHIKCPDCSCVITDTTISQFTSAEIADKYYHFVEVKRVEENLWVKWCPKADCVGYDVASPKNYKLVCNTCSYKYCYKCSQPWHNSRCKIKKDVNFELWAMANNVKICPRCKNHVQKNGGCPHMNCPRCNHRWCWICGGDYSLPSHNGFTCMLGSSYFDLYWGIIFLLILFPILIPFGFLLMVVYFYETETIETDRMNGIFSCLRIRIVAYSLAFIFSPAIEAIALVVGYFSITYAIASKNAYDISKLEVLFRLIIGNMICNVITILFFVVLALLIVVTPIVGCFFLVTKFYFVFSRCFKPKPGFTYPRLFG